MPNSEKTQSLSLHTELHDISKEDDRLPLLEESPSTMLFPLRFIGMGLLITWLCCTHVAAIFPGVEYGPDLRNVVDRTMRFGDIGLFLILAFFASRIGSLGKHPLVCALCVFLTAGGTACIGLVLIPLDMSEAVVRLCSIPTAFGGTILFCLWAEVYCQMGSVRVMIYGALSCIAAFLAYLIISVILQPYAIIATALLPLMSFACALLSFKAVPKERSKATNTHYPIPWKLFTIMIIAGFLSGLSGSLLPDLGGQGGAVHRIQVTGLAGITILFMVYALKERCDVRFLAKICLPIAVIAFAIIPIAGTTFGFLVSFLVKFAYVWFTFFVLIMLANLAYKFEIPSLRLFAIARAVSESAILVGVLLRDPLRSSGLLNDNLFLNIAMIVGLVLIFVCALIWMRDTSVNADWGAAGISIESGLHVPGPREKRLKRCEEIKEEYSLTTRESEILDLLSQHKTRAEIGQELFLSSNTIKTHVRNLYSKLNIHSKEDLLELFEKR